MILFLVVIVCNFNMFCKDKIIGIEVQIFMDNLVKVYLEEKLRDYGNEIFNLNFDKIVREVGYDIIEMFLDCIF